MKIKWLGHSSFLLEESTGTRVVTDPFEAEAVGYAMGETDADIVTVSRDCNDHNAVQNVKLNENAVILDSTGAYELQGIHITSISSNIDESDAAENGKNLIFKFRIDGVEVCHMGDINAECNSKIAELIGSVDVLLIPVGGNCTIDAESARTYVRFLMPDVAIPMHYRTSETKIDIDKAEPFIKLFEDEQIINVEGDSIEFDRSMFDGENTKLVVFDYNRLKAN